jgi:hypothetical protein
MHKSIEGVTLTAGAPNRIILNCLPEGQDLL